MLELFGVMNMRRGWSATASTSLGCYGSRSNGVAMLCLDRRLEGNQHDSSPYHAAIADSLGLAALLAYKQKTRTSVPFPATSFSSRGTWREHYCDAARLSHAFGLCREAGSFLSPVTGRVLWRGRKMCWKMMQNRPKVHMCSGSLVWILPRCKELGLLCTRNRLLFLFLNK